MEVEVRCRIPVDQAQEANELGRPMAQVAYAWVASRPGITAPIVGVSKLPQFDDALGALDLALSLEDIAALEAPYRPKPTDGEIRIAFATSGRYCATHAPTIPPAESPTIVTSRPSPAAMSTIRSA